ncbi:hypothetical protein EJB05_15775, partial [Eragrostis curvula]
IVPAFMFYCSGNCSILGNEMFQAYRNPRFNIRNFRIRVEVTKQNFRLLNQIMGIGHIRRMISALNE